jgi:hypothetical protein
MLEGFAYPDLTTALVVDASLLIVCTVLLLRYARLAHSHPGIVYLIFHTLVVTSRMLAVESGAETLFAVWGGIFEPVTEAEIARAALFADLTLVVMTAAWIRASMVDRRLAAAVRTDEEPRQTLSLKHIWSVAAIAFPLGIVGLVMLGRLPGIEPVQLELGDWTRSSWVAVTITWAGLSLLGLIYWYGFKWWLSVPMAAYLLVMSIQGYHRFRAIIPLVLLMQIFLDRRQRRWPPAVVTIGAVIAMLVFYPMKTVGRLAQEGATLGEITEQSSEILREVVTGQNADQMVLDQLASTLTLVDRADRIYYGSTYLAIVVAPVPRPLWPDKPGLAEYLQDFSAPSRPMAEMGMVTTFIGEFYLNFGLVGILILSWVTAYWLARVYFKAYRGSYYSVLRFGYLLVACNLIQIYRDGFMSLFVFTLINMMPLAVIVILHRVVPGARRIRPIPLERLPISTR